MLMGSWPDVVVQADMPADPPHASLRWLNVSKHRARGPRVYQTPAEACSVMALEAACLGGVRPSAGVAAIMRAHPASALSRLTHSTAVYLEANDVLPPGSCPGCPDDPLLNCTLRTLAWQHLGEVAPEGEARALGAGAAGMGGAAAPGTAGGAAGGEGRGGEGGGGGGGGGGGAGRAGEGRRVDFTMSAFWPADAAAVARTFHPLRAPLLLDVTLARLQACPSPAGKSSRKKADSAGNSSSSVEFNATLCAQLQVAEAWVVSAAAALIHTRASLEARFLRAQATARTAREILGLEGGRRLGERGSGGAGGADGGVEGEGAEGAEAAIGGADAAGAAEKGSFSVRRVPFAVAPTVCEAPKAESFGKQRFLRQFIVDEKLKAIYCFVPKVACTGWKTWFREQQGQSNVSDVFLTHDKARSGLRILAYHFPEHRVIELLTRPDFFKFSFVRNPYTRLASVYLNKHVGGGPPYSRQFWNKMFFRKFIPFRRLVKAKKGDDLFTLGEFAWLLRQMREQRRGRMESHVQPQIDACRFDKIRFDFVGRFENLAEDVGLVLQRLNRTVGESGAFKISKDAHPTNAGSKLLELYDEECEDVGEVLRRLNRTVGESGAFEISKDAHATNVGSKLLELYDEVREWVSGAGRVGVCGAQLHHGGVRCV
ncbi:unnamed protein product [Closterium sp. NIES-65]|nr:unnamed protein product [Closterium sp. NIES-65]